MLEHKHILPTLCNGKKLTVEPTGYQVSKSPLKKTVKHSFIAFSKQCRRSLTEKINKMKTVLLSKSL